MPVLRKHRTATRGMVRDTVTFAVADGTHDLYVYDGGDWTIAGAIKTSELICNDVRDTRFDYRSAALLTAENGRALPGAASNIAAKLTIVVKTGANAEIHLSRMGFERALAPGPITMKTEFGVTEGRPKTSLKTWGPDKASDWTPETIFEIDLSAQITEIRALGSAAIARFHWFWLPALVGFQAQSNYHIYSFDNDPAKAPRLSVSYDLAA